MRINVYSQEVTGETSLVTKTADTGIQFYGVRFFLASPDVLHAPPRDDDRSAVTIWLDNNFTGTQAFDLLMNLAEKAVEAAALRGEQLTPNMLALMGERRDG